MKTRLLKTFVIAVCLTTTFIGQARVAEPGLLIGNRHVKSLVRTSDEATLEDSHSCVLDIPLIIKLTDPDMALPEDVTVLYRRGPFVLAYVPETLVDDLAELNGVVRIEGSAECMPSLDQAREFTGYPDVEAAKNLPQQYTGRGVVVGFSDVGFDPNHIEFRDSQTGQSRVKMLVNYGEISEDIVRLTDAEQIADWSTDDQSEWHATHVAGIMAGGYKDNPYYGIATEADIVATTSNLNEALLLAGAEDVIAYAKAHNEPVVINMSISEAVGPHDGTSLFCQYLKLLSEDATICISAGNDGIRVGHWFGDFPEDTSTAAAVIDYHTWSPATAEGYLDIWGKDASPFQFAVVVHDLDTEQVVARIEMPEITAEKPEIVYTVASSGIYLSETGSDESEGMVSADFANFLNGFVAVSTEINPENNRFHALVHLDVVNHINEDGNISERYLVGLEVLGKTGQALDAYSDANLRMRSLPGYPSSFRITTEGTINDFITGEGTIGVGALCSRNDWPVIDGEDASGSYTVGDVTTFSSYSPNAVFGRLPDIVAPGAYLISSLSTPYVNVHPSLLTSMSYVTVDDGQSYYWKSACGTSMSSPYVAGVCALMLQANPSATPAQIKEAIIATASQPTVNSSDARWGKGILDSYGAISKILSISSVDLPGADDNTDLIPIEAFLNGDVDASIPYAIYNLQGVKMQPNSLSPGIYILQTPTATCKFAVR
jgi:subtilisin family serine protease